MKQVKSILLKDPLSWKFWILIAIIVKGLFFIFLISRGNANNIPGFWGAVATDTEGYIVPLENFTKTGNYTPDFRLPGLGIIYVPLLILFKKAIALNCLIVIQLILSSLSVYALALISRYIFKSDSLFYISFYLFLVSINSNMYDHVLLSESLATSFLIFAVFFFMKWKEKQKLFYLLLSGCMFTEAFFCKVIFLPVIFLLIIGIVTYVKERKKLLKIIFLFISPFLIADGLWVARNFYYHHKFIPLQMSPYYPGELDNYVRHTIIFLQSWGGNHVYWDPKAEIRWFGIVEKKHMVLTPLSNKYFYKIPSYIYTSQFNRDSLVNLKNEIYAYKNDSTKSTSEKEILQKNIILKFKRYTASVKSEKPFLYYVRAPLSYLKIFFVQSGTSELFNETNDKLNILELSYKIFYSLFYWIILCSGLIGLVLLIKNMILFKPAFIIGGILIYISFIYPLYFRYCEYRYFVPAWPYLIIFASYSLYLLMKSIFNRLNIKKIVTL